MSDTNNLAPAEPHEAGEPNDESSPSASDTPAPPKIWVELTAPFPPEDLPTDAPLNISPENTERIDFSGFLQFVREHGLLRMEYSFGPQAAESTNRARFLTLHFKPATDVASVAEELMRRREVIHAIEQRKLIPTAPSSGNPLDEPFVRPLLGGVVATDPATSYDNQWYLFRCKVDGAWRQNVSGRGIIIADIDWGFLTSHQEFDNRIAFQLNTLNGGSTVNGGLAIDHGTAVMGLVGAGINGLGIVGIAFASDLWLVQAGEDPNGTLDVNPWLRALEQVVAKTAPGQRKIILLEVQTEFSEPIDVVPPVRAAIKEAIAKEVVVCVAAANGSRDASLDVKLQPFPSSGAILVGATSYCPTSDPLAAHSNHGIRVPIYAPGDAMHDVTCSSDADDRYRNEFGGTSGATPKVTGTIALMLEANPKLSHYEIKDILRETGTQVTGDPAKIKGTFLNAEAAVAEAISRAII